MLHLDEVFAAEIYARDGIVVGGVKRAEGSFETMGFKWRFFWYFSFAIERKVRTFPQIIQKRCVPFPIRTPWLLSRC